MERRIPVRHEHRNMNLTGGGGLSVTVSGRGLTGVGVVGGAPHDGVENEGPGRALWDHQLKGRKFDEWWLCLPHLKLMLGNVWQ